MGQAEQASEEVHEGRERERHPVGVQDAEGLGHRLDEHEVQQREDEEAIVTPRLPNSDSARIATRIAEPFCTIITARYTEFQVRGGSVSSFTSSAALRRPSSSRASAFTRVMRVSDDSASASNDPSTTSSSTSNPTAHGSAGHPAVPLLSAPHLGALVVGLVVVAEDVQHPVHHEEPKLRRVLGIVARRDGGRDHDVAQHPDAVLVEIVVAERERQHVGRDRLLHVPLVQLGDLVLVDERTRKLTRSWPSAAAWFGELGQRSLVDRRRARPAVGHEDPGMAAVVVVHRARRHGSTGSACCPNRSYASTMSCTILCRTTSLPPR